MNLLYKLVMIFTVFLMINACDSVDRFSILKQCTVLGDESIVYARAHYVKLFYHYNPNKFKKSYNKIRNFDAVTHRNTINNYARAIDKIISNKKAISDEATLNLLYGCSNLAIFTTDFVDNIYSKAIEFDSSNDPLTDDFFIQINQLVKFDHKIGTFDESDISFKQNIDRYRSAVETYINKYKTKIPSEFTKQRKLNPE